MPCKLFAAIFPARCDAAAQMPLCFVRVQNAFDVQIQIAVEPLQSLHNVFMYRGFRDIKLLCRFSDRAFIFNHVMCELDRSFLDVGAGQTNAPSAEFYRYRHFMRRMRKIFFKMLDGKGEMRYNNSVSMI